MSLRLRPILSRLLPDSWGRWYWRNVDVPKLHARFARLTPAETFSAIYRERLWQESSTVPFHSGDGSADAYGLPYIQAVQSFLERHDIRTVADLGCGDFRIGRRLAALVDHYDGVDCVPELIAHLRQSESAPNVAFHCLDLIRDPLPTAGAALIRQVLQHLSNQEILAALRQCANYRYLIVTEHVPGPTCPEPNLDHQRGPNTRLLFESGVYLEHPPFSRPITPLLELSDGAGALFRTVIVENTLA